MAPAIAPDAKIPCLTPQHLHTELEELTWALEPEEKEDTWEKFERAIIRFAAVTRGGGYKHVDMYVEGVGRKGVGTKLAKCMLSDRGRLSGVATDLLQTFAPRLAQNFKPLVTLYLESLVTLLGRPNKVFLKRAEKCLLTIITHCQINTILPELRRGLSDNAATCRRYCAIGIERAVRDWSMDLWTEKYIVQLEESVRKMATDKDPETRQTGKRVWATFMELWPERVDDFSAPLTPTIRRYLDIPAANGAGPSRPKAASRPAAPPLRPISAASSASSLGSAAASRPLHNRVNALASRPMRTAPIQEHVEPAPIEAGPSRRQSPQKVAQYFTQMAEPEINKTEGHPPAISRSTSSHSRAMDMLPPGILGRFGRSVSHNIISSSSTTSHPDYEITSTSNRYNPLPKPVRPALPNTLSTISLPANPTDIPPTRRFAPPARIIRVVPASDEEGSGDHMSGDFPFSASSGDSVLRGAVRPAIGRGRTASGLGQAQRRIVTAPASISEETTQSVAFKTPGLGARSYSQRRLAEEIAHQQQEESAEEVSESPIEHHQFNSPAPAQAQHVDSPLLPVLIRSSSSDQIRAIDNEESDGIIDMQEDVYPVSPMRNKVEVEEERKVVQMAAAIELPSSPAKELVELAKEKEEEEQKEAVVAIQEEEPTLSENVAIATSNLDQEEVVAPPIAEAEVEHKPQTESATVEPGAITKTSPVKSSASTASLRSSPAQSSAINSTKQPVAPAPRRVIAAAPAPPAPTIKAKVALPRKPAVPLAPGRTARTASAPISRKPFKPTSLTAATAASAAKAGPVTDPAHTAPAPAVVSKSSVSTSTTAKVTTAPTTTTTTKPPLPPVPKAQPVKVVAISEPKVTIKPPIPPAAAARPAQPRIVSGTRKPVVTAQVPLPAAKKEKVRLKAPLPSFRPTRTTGTSSSASAAVGKKALTSSMTSTSSGRARIRPENIKLPDSPAHGNVKPAEVALPPSPHEVPLPPTPVEKEKAPSIPSSISKSSSSTKPSPLRLEVSIARTRAGSGSASTPQSPITLAPPRPVSPLLTTAGFEITQPIFTLPPSTSTGASSMGNEELNDLGLPTNDPFASVSNRTQFSKTSTVPAVSPGRDDTSFFEGEGEEEMEGVTFKLRNVKAALSKDHSVEEQQKEEGKIVDDLIEISGPSRKVNVNTNAFAPRTDVSTPSKSASALLSKLEGMNGCTPAGQGGERKVLSVKDTNTNTPGPTWIEGDVSASS